MSLIRFSFEIFFPLFFFPTKNNNLEEIEKAERNDDAKKWDDSEIQIKVEEQQDDSHDTIPSPKKSTKVDNNVSTEDDSISKDPPIPKPKSKSKKSRKSKSHLSPPSPNSPDGKDRVQEVIKELLTIAKQDNDRNPKQQQQPEIKGLRLLLSNNNHNNNTISGNNTISNNNPTNNGDPPPSPTMLLLYELQELLGYGDAESSKQLKENRRSLPNMPNKSYLHDEDDDFAKIFRRRSTPVIKTNSRFDDVNPSKAKALHPHGADAVKPSFWASSLGLLNPWKVE